MGREQGGQLSRIKALSWKWGGGEGAQTSGLSHLSGKDKLLIRSVSSLERPKLQGLSGPARVSEGISSSSGGLKPTAGRLAGGGGQSLSGLEAAVIKLSQGCRGCS